VFKPVLQKYAYPLNMGELTETVSKYISSL